MSPRVKSGTLSLFIESHTLTELYILGTSCAIRNFDHDMYPAVEVNSYGSGVYSLISGGSAFFRNW